MTTTDVNLALRKGFSSSHMHSKPSFKPLGLLAGWKAYRTYQLLQETTAEARKEAGVTRADLPRLAARAANLIS